MTRREKREDRMAGIKTHISTSTALGVVYGAGGVALGIPWETSLVAGGLCAVSGMLPDLDSDSGIPLRETSTFLAAMVPVMLIHRFEQLGLTNEQMILAAGAVYVLIRFVLVEVFKRYTVHRGMWHSYPAAAIAGLGAFLICSNDEVGLRMFKAGGVVLGFMSHLVLDEIWSIERGRLGWRMKKSAGTALKFYSKSTWSNVSTYGKLLVLVLLVFGDDFLMTRMQSLTNQVHPRVVETIDQGQGEDGTIKR